MKFHPLIPAENVKFQQQKPTENVNFNMKRKIYNELLNWKREGKGKSALLIEGARRIGKSFIVEEFARNEYDSYILIDFNNVEKSVIDIFEKYTSQLDMFFQLLSLHFNVQLVNRNSLIIFDEVQQYPPARAAIKYLVADGRYDYIETGSLISIRKNVQNIVIPSEEHHLNMFPMDFEEFLWAMGQKQLFSFMQDCFIKRQALGPLHQKAMDLFRLYMTIGGMPQVVQEYINTKDFRQAELIKQDILSLYKNDIHKYATGAEAKAANIFEAIPSQLQKQGTHFTLTDIDENARYTNYASSFFWLADSRIVNICYNTFAPNIGLGMNTERTTLKCYLGDTGLLISMAFNENNMVPAEVYERLIHGKLEVNLGIIVENIVAQILRANGHTLYYYQKSDKQNAANNMEIDFLISKSKITSHKNICPIEVKSTNRYTTTSLNKCITKFSQYIGEPFVLHTNDVKQANGITYLPIYMASFL